MLDAASDAIDDLFDQHELQLRMRAINRDKALGFLVYDATGGKRDTKRVLPTDPKLSYTPLALAVLHQITPMVYALRGKNGDVADADKINQNYCWTYVKRQVHQIFKLNL